METMHLSNDADSSTITKKNPDSNTKFAKKQTIFEQGFYTLFKQKLSNLRPILSITFPQEFWKS